MPLGEFGLIGRYFQRQVLEQAGGQAKVALGIGDDAALLDPTPGCQWVISTDSLVQGVHFPEPYSPADLGYRALAVALSDLAAMAATPLARARWAASCSSPSDISIPAVATPASAAPSSHWARGRQKRLSR